VSTRRRRQAVQDGLRSVSAASDLLDAAVAEYLCLHRTDLRCLDFLARVGPVPAGHLGVAVGLTSGALTIAVDRLHYLFSRRRQNDPDDRRRVLVALAPAAEQVVGLFADLRVQTQRRLATYSDPELQLLDTFLQDMSRALSEQAFAIWQRSNPDA
jgi:DNA-binding MarR family transcriptional regulator